MAESGELEKRLEALYEKKQECDYLVAACRDCESSLKREREVSPFKRAAALFSFPFKQGAFAAIGECAFSALCTIIFAGVASVIMLGALFCAIVDFVWMLLFWVLYPVLVLLLFIIHPVRLWLLKAKKRALDAEMKEFDPAALTAEVKAVERELDRARKAERDAEPYVPRTSGVEETEWYKNKVDDEYRRLMGLPPRDNSLPAYATDVTLDMHPGDY